MIGSWFPLPWSLNLRSAREVSVYMDVISARKGCVSVSLGPSGRRNQNGITSAGGLLGKTMLEDKGEKQQEWGGKSSQIPGQGSDACEGRGGRKVVQFRESHSCRAKTKLLECVSGQSPTGRIIDGEQWGGFTLKHSILRLWAADPPHNTGDGSVLCMASWLPWIYMCGIFKKEVKNWAILVIPGEKDLMARAQGWDCADFPSHSLLYHLNFFLFQCLIQWYIVYSQCCATTTSI